MRRYFFLIFFCWLLPYLVHGQDLPYNFTAEFKTGAAIEGTLPFWHYANQWGEVDPSGANTILKTGFTKRFFENSDRWDLELGTELISRYSKNPTAFFKQLYSKLDYSIFRLQVGRYEDITGNVNKTLSMGSMSFSGNATPLPKVKVSIPEFQPLPLTGGYIKIRGAWGHGWMENDRYTRKALLIEQYGYARIGGDLPLNLIGGLHHFSFWGGNNRSFGNIPETLDDFFNVAFALGEGGQDAPPVDQAYFLGDHKGYWDFGAEINLQRIKINLYRQFILEDKDNVKLKSPQDGLYGVSVENKNGELLQAFLWEFLYTKWQNGPIFDVPENGRGGIGGRDNYYNHSTYRSGWTYFGNTIGTPLLFPRGDGLGIANNRVVAHHWGMEGALSSVQDYQLMVTYSRNYGTYNNPIEPRKDSYSIITSTDYRPERWDNISFSASLAADFRELHGSNLGLMLGISWNY